MSNDFSHLSELDVSGRQTVEYTLYHLEGEPTLILSPATQSNKPYFNALLKRSRKNQAALKAGAINSGMIDGNRDEDRELYPLYIVQGWRRVTDSSGAEVPFAKDVCSSFLHHLPDWIFDEVREFAGSPQNFVSQPFANAAATAKN